jgi:hypothetical protein
MSLAEIMPVVRSLPHDEKVELRNYLDLELATHVDSPVNGSPIVEGELLRQLRAAALLYREPVECSAEGIAALQALLADESARIRAGQ